MSKWYYAGRLIFLNILDWTMSIVIEKRSGRERRLVSGQPPVECGERRVDERRQTSISDIPFFEWATHFAAFQRGVNSKNSEASADIDTAAPKDGDRK